MTTLEEVSCWKEGRKAYAAGLSRSDNPYSEGPQKKYWRMGWDKAWAGACKPHDRIAGDLKKESARLRNENLRQRRERFFKSMKWFE